MPRHELRSIDRRAFLGLAGLSWLTPLGQILARQAETSRQPARSLILIWLAGGPSQLETFDPHPGTLIAGGTRAIATPVAGIQLAEGLEHLAELIPELALVRSLVSEEGDHERGTLKVKTGYRPDPSVAFPSIGAICCHELPAGPVEIPRHISILASQWPSRGGFLGSQYDAFQVGDPAEPLPDVRSSVAEERLQSRLADLDVVERAFTAGRRDLRATASHRQSIERARTMMSSQQLRAFDVDDEPISSRRAYGDTPFGRGCLAARRLIEVGVRCVEVTLPGWDSHINNHEIQRGLVNILDPALAALIRDLKARDQLDQTLVLCLGEFGRTPAINVAGGRDHWPGGFSAVVAGGRLRKGLTVGGTDPQGKDKPQRPVPVADLHATVLTALGLDPIKLNFTPVTGRPVKLADGTPLPELLG